MYMFFVEFGGVLEDEDVKRSYIKSSSAVYIESPVLVKLNELTREDAENVDMLQFSVTLFLAYMGAKQARLKFKVILISNVDR